MYRDEAELIEARLADARARRLTARDTREWTRARAQELALEEALFGLTGQHFAFNPNLHPRDRGGEFAGALGKIQHGDTVHLPGGVAVTRTRQGFKVRHRRDLAPDVGKQHFTDARAAADYAIAQDPTPRENDRIGGVRHRQGAALGMRDVRALPAGTPVVAKGEFGRFGGVERDKRGTLQAVVHYDHPTDARTVTRRYDPRHLSLAEPAENAGGGATKMSSPGRGMETVVKLNPAGDALHFLHHFGGVVSDPKNVPEVQAVARTLGRPASLAERDRARHQLRRAGIVPATG